MFSEFSRDAVTAIEALRDGSLNCCLSSVLVPLIKGPRTDRLLVDMVDKDA